MAAWICSSVRISRDLLDAKDGAEVVALDGPLKAPLKLQQRRILQVEQCEAAEIAVTQRIGDLGGLALIDDEVDMDSQAVAQREKSQRTWSSPALPSHLAASVGEAMRTV